MDYVPPRHMKMEKHDIISAQKVLRQSLEPSSLRYGMFSSITNGYKYSYLKFQHAPV